MWPFKLHANITTKGITDIWVINKKQAKTTNSSLGLCQPFKLRKPLLRFDNTSWTSPSCVHQSQQGAKPLQYLLFRYQSHKLLVCFCFLWIQGEGDQSYKAENTDLSSEVVQDCVSSYSVPRQRGGYSTLAEVFTVITAIPKRKTLKK